MRTIEFGFYPYESNGQMAPIRWKVIDTFESGRIGIVSEEIIDSGRFDKKNSSWTGSDLRRWLNVDFKNTAFSAEQQKLIYGEIFVMSFEEAMWYFPTANSRAAKATPYAKKQKLSLDKQGRGRYWHISPGYVPTAVTYTDTDGYTYETGMHVTSREGIRPALILDVDPEAILKIEGEQNEL